MSDGKICLLDVLDRIRSSTIKCQKEGVADLRHVFASIRNTPKVQSIERKEWRIIFETLFRAAASDRALLEKSHARSSLSSVSARLSSIATTLREVIESGVQFFDAKIVKLILEHIQTYVYVETLKICKPIALDYLKCLKVILAFQPHTEHLRHYWLSLTQFCINCCRVLSGASGSMVIYEDGFITSKLRSSNPSQESKEIENDSRARKVLTSELSPICMELVQCLKYLLLASNAPVLELAEQLITVLFELLISAKRTQADVLTCLNLVLARTTPEHCQITQSCILNLLPLFHNLWAVKDMLLKEQILTSLIICRWHLTHLAYVDRLDLEVLESLLLILFTEYTKRQPKDLISLNRLIFFFPGQSLRDYGHISFLSVAMNPLYPEPSSIFWCIPFVLGYYYFILDKHTLQKSDGSSGLRDSILPIKRQRKCLKFDDLMDSAGLSTSIDERITSLQILAIMIPQLTLTEECLEKLLSKLTPLIPDENLLVSNWSLITLANCAFQVTSAAPSMRSKYADIWVAATRLLPTASCGRAAGHLMNVLLGLELVPCSVIRTFLDELLVSFDMTCPTSLSDSILSLWENFLQFTISLSSFSWQSLSERILNWLMNKWKCHWKVERGGYMAISANFSALDVANLARICLRRPLVRFRFAPLVILDRIGRVWSRSCEEARQLKYLLLLPDEDVPRLTRKVAIGATNETGCQNLLREFSSSEDMEKRLFEYLVLETETSCQSFKGHDWASSSKVVMMRGATMQCILNSCLSYQSDDTLKCLVETLKKGTNELLKYISKGILKSSYIADNVDSVLMAVCECTPAMSEFQNLDPDAFERVGLFPLLLYISRSLDARVKVVYGDRDDDGEIPTEAEYDSDFEDNDTLGSTRLSSFHQWCTDWEQRGDVRSVRLYVASLAHLVSHAFEAMTPGTANNQVPHNFIKHITNYSVADFCACEGFLSSLVSSSLDIGIHEGEMILEFVGRNLLQNYKHERSEIPLKLVIRLVSGFVKFWRHGGGVWAKGRDIYEWLVNNASTKGVFSSYLRICVIDLLIQVTKEQNEDEQTQEGLGWAGRAYIKLMENSEVSVMHHVSLNIHEFFNCFSSEQQERVFEEIFRYLPHHTEWVEVIFMRQLIVSRIGIEPKLVGRCVYDIVNIAGTIQQSLDHGKLSLCNIGKRIGLTNGREIFTVFSRQILFGWIENNRQIESLPYACFGFTTIEEMVMASMEEVIAQLAMRAQYEELENVNKLLGRKLDMLLKEAFERTIAYMIIWNAEQLDKSIKEFLVRAKIKRIPRVKFAKVLGYLMQRTESYQINFDALSLLKGDEMIKMTQPSWKIGYVGQPRLIGDELMLAVENLCKLSNIDWDGVWTEGLYIYLVRFIMASDDGGTGGYFERLKLAQVGIAISFAKDIALKGYALEMTLRMVRKYLTDSVCSLEAIKIAKHLIARSSDIKGEKTDETLIGYCVSVYLWLNKFIKDNGPGYENINEFCQWVHQFLRTIRGADRFFKLLDQTNDCTEWKVLVEMFKEEVSHDKVISERWRDYIISTAIQTFDSECERVLEVDAVRYGYQVWKTLKKGNASKQYVFWSGRVLGEAFFRGIRCSVFGIQWKHEQEDWKGISSGGLIIKTLCDSLYSESSRTVSIVEDTLRRIFCLGQKGKEDKWIAEACVDDKVIIGLRLNVDSSAEDRKRSATFELKDCDERVEDWAKSLCIWLCSIGARNGMVWELKGAIEQIDGLGELLLNPIVHMTLAEEVRENAIGKAKMGTLCKEFFNDTSEGVKAIRKALLSVILYLRGRGRGGKNSKAGSAERNFWFKVDFLEASRAALQCGMFSTALMLAEISWSECGGRERFNAKVEWAGEMGELLLRIYGGLDEPDSFYGVEEGSSFDGILRRLDYEKDGGKSLLIRGATIDSRIQLGVELCEEDLRGTIESFDDLNLGYYGLVMNEGGRKSGIQGDNVASKLEQWRLDVEERRGVGFGGDGRGTGPKIWMNDENTKQSVIETVEEMVRLSEEWVKMNSMQCQLGCLWEQDRLRRVNDIGELEKIWKDIEKHDEKFGEMRWNEVRRVVLCRRGMFRRISERVGWNEVTQKIEMKGLIRWARAAREYGLMGDSVSMVMYMRELSKQWTGVQILREDIEIETARMLWEQGERDSSIKILKKVWERLKEDDRVKREDFQQLACRLAYEVEEAKVERVEDIMKEYYDKLDTGGETHQTANAMARGYSEYAKFCDRQVRQGGYEERILRKERGMALGKQEMDAYEKVIKEYRSKEDEGKRKRFEKRVHDMKKWREIGEEEIGRLRKTWDKFVLKGLENYLRSMESSDDFDDISSVGFLGLWFEHRKNEKANCVVKSRIEKVGSGKFVWLMEQLMSRLGEQSNNEADKQIKVTSNNCQTENKRTPECFLSLIKALILRICFDHPYHGMPSIYTAIEEGNAGTPVSTFSSTNAGVTRGPTILLSSTFHSPVHSSRATMVEKRALVAREISGEFNARRTRISQVWRDIYLSSSLYYDVARMRVKREESHKMELYRETRKLLNTIPRLNLPPPTLNVRVRNDGDYFSPGILPKVTGFKEDFIVAEGLSMPKIIVEIADNGQSYKCIVKDGSSTTSALDATSCKRDVVMQQVLNQINRILHVQFQARFRALRIRTYKVLPLKFNASIIQFIDNTLSLAEYLSYAHHAYHPSDLPTKECRKKIFSVMKRDSKTRLSTFKLVCSQYSPVLHQFFFERYLSADEWFSKRTAYTRSVATNSITGYILGIGDRHLQNILIDETSGELVHVDFEVCFESGKILPIPENVPFRLTRDIIDAMGCTGYEGVFRRCCQFTLGAMNEHRECILTLLNVLKFDPFYDWSITSLRAKRIQNIKDDEDHEDCSPIINSLTPLANDLNPTQSQTHFILALNTVKKKLNKDKLSIKATVNELIQQATDPRNLSVLFAGWAAYS